MLLCAVAWVKKEQTWTADMGRGGVMFLGFSHSQWRNRLQRALYSLPGGAAWGSSLISW